MNEKNMYMVLPGVGKIPDHAAFDFLELTSDQARRLVNKVMPIRFEPVSPEPPIRVERGRALYYYLHRERLKRLVAAGILVDREWMSARRSLNDELDQLRSEMNDIGIKRGDASDPSTIIRLDVELDQLRKRHDAVQSALTNVQEQLNSVVAEWRQLEKLLGECDYALLDRIQVLQAQDPREGPAKDVDSLVLAFARAEHLAETSHPSQRERLRERAENLRYEMEEAINSELENSDEARVE